jgi:hypothetical protein
VQSHPRVSIRLRRQNAPSVLKQRGESGLRAALLGAGNRVAGNEMRMRRDMRRHLADHRGFGRADIGYNRARLEVAADFHGHGPGRADRNRHDHQIRIANQFGIRGVIAVPQFKRARGIKRCSAPRGDRHMPGKPLGCDDASQGRTDEADADQGNGIEHGLGHGYRAMKVVSASMTPRLASSLPMVILSASGRP